MQVSKMLYWLQEIQPEQILAVGSKALSLNQMQQQGYPVLSGLIISSNMFEEFLELSLGMATLKADFTMLDVENWKALQVFANQSREHILTFPLPQDWLDSIVQHVNKLSTPLLSLSSSVSGVVGNLQQWQQLLSSQFSQPDSYSLSQQIKNIWADLFSAKSLFLAKKNQLNLEDLKLAILIQPCYQVIASGSTEINQSFFKITASWGYELSQTKGEVLPDSYQVNRLNQEEKTQKLGNKMITYNLNQQHDSLKRYILPETQQKKLTLTPSNLQKITDLAVKIAQQYPNINQFHWNFCKSSPVKLYLTQVIPEILDNMDDHQNNSHLILRGLGASPGRITADALVIADGDDYQQNFTHKPILVLKSLTPSHLPLIKQAAGIITESGGMTSHGAIMARELGIPAIVGVKRATQLIKTNTTIQVNGDTGIINLSKSENTAKQTEEIKPSLPQEVNLLANFYPIATRLLVNISQTESLTPLSNLPIDGVGLLRSEFFLLNLLAKQPLESWIEREKSMLLTEFSQFITQITSNFASLPVFYRSVDWSNLDLPEDCLRFKQDLFSLQLESLLNVMRQNSVNLKLILPFIRSVEEFKNYYRQIEEMGLLSYASFEVWIMAEVPSVIFQLSEYVAAGVQGISIGTNDLTQLLLGIDRESPSISPELTVKHPAVQIAIKKLIKLAKKNNIPCSICGQGPVQYPEIITDLVKWGITSISVETQAIAQTYRAIARAEHSIILDSRR